MRKNGMWLIEFYAPWCGHCRKLEPVYRQVFTELKNSGSGVIVSKIDATRYSNVASEFDVRGFPTLKFVNGDKVYTHRGDRSKEDILDFVNKAKGPAVRNIASVGKFNEIKTLHGKSVFFMFVGNGDENDDLFKKYSSLAEKHIIESYFYSGPKNSLPDKVTIKTFPTVLVFKDKNIFEFDVGESEVVTKDKLEKWLNRERFPAFPKVQGGGLNELVTAAKYLVIVVVNKDSSVKNECKKVKKVVSNVALNHRQKYHQDFQFLWMPDEETANSITMSFLNIPSIVVLETASQLHYISDKNVTDLTEQSIQDFLDGIKVGKVDAYGGTGFLSKLKRAGFDFLTTVLSIWQASRWLFLLMFGLPTVIISVVCYSLCCMETIDEGVNSDDEDMDEYEGQRRELEENEENDQQENHEPPKIDHEKYE
ncbi:hypothetical protein LOTGIDRAFT_206090 [Lottia gigantea]|uniref:Thioredoxin domain-containing protein n=1 Tax=Lottia gigantea TaxID=225164 RepID=V4B8B0_LOTGI|nr:hypothetical protein LOTGIDRAFT_206090 [Lottia gigantea]ESP01942.1 hypothetical protein LOTGIDRAFT_206090 [Lottia gigantea]